MTTTTRISLRLAVVAVGAVGAVLAHVRTHVHAALAVVTLSAVLAIVAVLAAGAILTSVHFYSLGLGFFSPKHLASNPRRPWTSEFF